MKDHWKIFDGEIETGDTTLDKVISIAILLIVIGAILLAAREFINLISLI